MKKAALHLIKDFLRRMKEDDISAWASKLTFFILLSIFPFMIFLIEILSHVSIDSSEGIQELTQFFPPEILALLELIVEDITKTDSPSSVLPIAIIAAVWAASKGILAIISGLNVAYDETETRNYFFLRLISIIYTIAFAIIILITLVLMVFGNKIIRFITLNVPFLADQAAFFDSVRVIFSVFSIFIFFTLLYNTIPNRKITFRDVIPGALFATFGWISLSYLFSIYVNASKSISYMYGSLTSIILLMLWLYISCTIIMIGGEINAVVSKHKKTLKDGYGVKS